MARTNLFVNRILTANFKEAFADLRQVAMEKLGLSDQEFASNGAFLFA